MGYLRRIKHARRRFNELYEGYGMTGCKFFYFADYLVSFVVNGASWKDYFGYKFYEKRWNGRNKYITFRRFNKMLSICNKQDCIKYLRDKSLFNERYADFLHRDVIDLKKCTKDDFIKFWESHSDVFVKEVLGYRGSSVWFYSTKDTDGSELYDKFMHETNCHYIAESKLQQHEALAYFHPMSVNTIRIVTLYDDVKDIVHFMFAKLRMGNHGAYLDNTHAGGISGNIDLITGVINTPGYSVTSNEEHIRHPYSGKQIIGFQIPYWEECKRFIEKAARVTPEVRYVGWDVVILKDGDFALIEANDNADHDGQQIRYRGMWKDYSDILKNLRRL